jgi:NADH dehydrogenase [ubiquinone] 1 alpha subcomplex assembly factor 1
MLLTAPRAQCRAVPRVCRERRPSGRRIRQECTPGAGPVPPAVRGQNGLHGAAGDTAPMKDATPAMTDLLFDFSDPAAVQGWTAIDDRVMGGVSRSRLRHDPSGHAVFEGEVSLAQGGGFASVRCVPGPLGRPGATACRIQVQGGSGRSFRLALVSGDALDTVSHQAGFRPEGPDWQVLTLPLQAFRARFRGRELPAAPALDPARVRQVGLLVGERQAGAFALGIRGIALVRCRPAVPGHRGPGRGGTTAESLALATELRLTVWPFAVT